MLRSPIYINPLIKILVLFLKSCSFATHKCTCLFPSTCPLTLSDHAGEIVFNLPRYKVLTAPRSRGYTNRRIIPRPAPSVHGCNDLMFSIPRPSSHCWPPCFIPSLAPHNTARQYKKYKGFWKTSPSGVPYWEWDGHLLEGKPSYLNKPLSAHLLPLSFFFFLFLLLPHGINFYL